jgi:hypothetical protein
MLHRHAEVHKRDLQPDVVGKSEDLTSESELTLEIFQYVYEDGKREDLTSDLTSELITYYGYENRKREE